jgi:hypothetical protein
MLHMCDELHLFSDQIVAYTWFSCCISVYTMLEHFSQVFIGHGNMFKMILHSQTKNVSWGLVLH